MTEVLTPGTSSERPAQGQERGMAAEEPAAKEGGTGHLMTRRPNEGGSMQERGEAMIEDSGVADLSREGKWHLRRSRDGDSIKDHVSIPHK